MTGPAAPDALLVAVEFSPSSLRAVEVATSWLAPGAEVTLVHVIDTALAARIEASGIATRAEAIAKMRSLAERELAAIGGTGGREVSSMVVEGVPFAEIVKIANDLDCGLIVLGSRATDVGLEQVLFGGTAEKVLRAARRPVLCVP